MKLKEIKPGMAIHCKTGLEAEKLFSVLRNCGIKWLSGDDLMSTFFYEHADTGTCYFIDSENKLSRSSFEYFTNNTGKYGEIIPFSSLIIEEKTYEDGLNEAWEFVRKVSDISYKELSNIFGVSVENPWGELIDKHSASEAIAKLEVYETEKQIKVGDVVEYIGKRGIVTRIDGERFYITWSDGVCDANSRRGLIKTGKHIDISSILAEIGKE